MCLSTGEGQCIGDEERIILPRVMWKEMITLMISEK